MATLVVVRHAEAEGNQDHRFLGHSQMPLTDHGREQARIIASRLATEEVARIVTSDLVRCVETVTPLSESVGVEVEESPRLREIDNGEWTGLLPEEIAAGWPELWEDYVGGQDVQRPAGERWSDVAARVIPLAAQLLDEDGVIVMSTHSGPTMILAHWAAGSRVEGNVFRGQFGALHNGSLTVIAPGPRLISFNDVGHLAPLPDQRLPFTPVSPS